MSNISTERVCQPMFPYLSQPYTLRMPGWRRWPLSSQSLIANKTLLPCRYNVEEMYTDASVKSKLIISKVSASDSGRYVCVAENSLGKHEAAMELEIKGRHKTAATSTSPTPPSQKLKRFVFPSIFTVLGSPPDDLSCNMTTANSVRLRWTDLNANNNLMSDYTQGYVLTYTKTVAPDDLTSEFLHFGVRLFFILDRVSFSATAIS